MGGARTARPVRLALGVERLIGQLDRELRRQPTVDEVAGAIDAEPEEVLEAM